ncbi:hypothetical protein B0H63DRAFT_562705 [Podospora didyma]|uniref:Caspase domain-containing protein n=1 Tax=Podospora didyma TaxID=330526 RepID=A0AAE0KES9_9PEZI|nr:hypothetical protein B0H63DRAFT_562705 [Podospora didyma]
MSRFNHNHQYDYGYGPVWGDAGTFHGDVASAVLTSPPRRSGTGYSDRDDRAAARKAPSSREREREGERERERDRERDRDRDRDRERDWIVVDREKDNLKQRLKNRTNATTSPPSHVVPRHNNANHSRARSLSLSRITSSSSSLSERERDRDRDYYRDDDDSPTRSQNHRPMVKYYQNERFSVSSPRVPLAPSAGWPLSSPAPRTVTTRESPNFGPRYPPDHHRGFLAEQARHMQTRSADPLPHLSSRDDIRYGMQRMALVDPRMPSNRSASYDTPERNDGRGVVVRRKGVSMSPGRGVISPAPYHNVRNYNQVHVLIITWSFHDLKTAPYTAVPDADYISLEDETKRLRDTLHSYGYKVHEYEIPMVRAVESLRSKIKQFCRYAADDTLLMIYYHGHGALDDDNELVFSSHEHPDDPNWSQNAAAELYAALMSGDACPSHGRHNQFKQLIKKYERYRPVSDVRWEDIRATVLGAPCDLLLILDCCAAGGANLGHVNWQPPPSAENYTKHLFAACGFESSTSDDMTAVLCDVLDEWVPEPPIPQKQGGRGPSPAAPGAPFLTTKRLHQIMEDKLQKDSSGSQPIFKQLLPLDPERYIALPNLLERERATREREAWGVAGDYAAHARGRRGYIMA